MQNMKLCTRACALLVEKYGTGTYIIDHVYATDLFKQ